MEPTPTDLRHAIAEIDLGAPPSRMADACVAALSPVIGRTSLHLPAVPIPIQAGAPRDGLDLIARFPGPEGEGELWGEAGALSAHATRELQEQLTRIWSVQAERAAASREMDQLRFHLASLQQVAHSLAVVRSTPETEGTVVDSTREVFFAWWAALYRTDANGDWERRVVRAMRDEAFPDHLPFDPRRNASGTEGQPFVPAVEAPLREHFPSDLGAIAPLELGEGASAVVALGARMNDAAYAAPDLALLRALADASAIALRNSNLLERLRNEAVRDALTGCQNRRGFDQTLASELMRAQRYDRSLSMILLDIDHFKQVNDTYGHEVGDRALRLVGATLTQLFRATDQVCRVGGEEFAMVFPETSKEDALQLAERARIAVAGIPAERGLPRTLTISLGIAGFPEDGDAPDALYRGADRALYRAKSGGRNRSELARPEDRSPAATTQEVG